MLRATVFPAPLNSVPVVSGTHTCHSLASTRVIYPRSSLISRFQFRQFRPSHLKNILTVAAGKKQWDGGAVTEEGFDEVEDVFDEYDDVDDEVEEGEEEEYDDGDIEEMLPLEQMRKWLEKKPKGFGEGKVYDTSVEDKLLEEMRQSRETQVANLKKLKENPVKPSSNKNDQKKKETEIVVPVGSGRVRLVNLPKKKNIHRDLKSAFEGIPGIINIVPAVTGNKKTRDPVCKGFAFVDFKHEKDAVRFVELYTGQTISFGKIQKQIKCELLNAQSSSSSLKLSKNLNTGPHLMVSAFEDEDSNEDTNMGDSTLSSWDATNLDDSDEQQESDEENQEFEESFDENQEFAGSFEENVGFSESDEENQEFAAALKEDFDDSVEMSADAEINSLPTLQVNENPTADEKSHAKVTKENAPKKKPTSKKKVKKVLDIPGSAKRLKIKEKAVLSDVFSKYASKAALRIMSYLPPPYSALSSLLVIPTPIRDAVYDYVAKHRYEWFGKDEDCLVLKEKELLGRFIDREEIMNRDRDL